MSRMWMVRAGEGAFLIDRFEKKNRIAIGWEIGDLTNIKSQNEIKNLILKTYSDKKEGYINITASQINKFRFEFQKGDNVISYDPQNRVYLVGTIQSDYFYDNKFYPDNLLEYCDNREVKWLGKVNRDDLSTSTKNTLGAISTIFEINQVAAQEILKIMKGENPINPLENEEDELEELKKDIILKSSEFMEDKIANLDWEEMQELVAGLLRGMGYKTIVSSKGPDRGRDIVASPDGLGLKDPKILVEVKHRNGQMGSSDIRRFTGGLRGKDKGLYVSTGGFTKEARYEAERSNIPIALVDLDLLVNLIVQYYENFDAEARALLPLTKIYWPI